MKLMRKLVICLLLLTMFVATTASTIVDGQLVLDEPVPYPTNFQQLYCLVEGCPNMPAHQAWRFEQCDVYGSQLHWDSAVKLFTNTPERFEQVGFFLVTSMFFENWIDVCGDKDGKPIMFGPGVDEFFKWYSNPEGYNYIVIKDFLEGIGTAMERMNIND